jgi:N-acetylneuraminic acid mutarotase
VKNRRLLHIVLALSWLTVVSCAEETTAPNTGPTSAGPDFALASNTWLTRRNMPLDLIEQATAVVPNAAGQSILYAIGGGKADSPLPGALVPMGEVRAYNVATNTWTSKQDMPVARWGMNGAGVINGKIYVTGGYTKAGYRGVTASLFVYNTASNTWTRKRDMPAAGGDGVTGVIRGKLYVATFNYSSSDPAKWFMNFFRYNPTTDSWTKLPNPTDYSTINVGGGVINNKLYLMGGGRLLEYDPITSQWTQKRPWTNQSCLPGLPCYVEGPTAVMLAHLYVFGREWKFDGTWTPSIFIYDPVSDTWDSKPLLTTFSYWDANRLTAARVFLNGKPRVEVIGGYRPGNNQQYIP